MKSKSLLPVHRLVEFQAYCEGRGWVSEPAIGEWEVLRMRKKRVPVPLFVYRSSQSATTGFFTVHGIAHTLALAFVRGEQK